MMTSSERIMGAAFVNSQAINAVAWTIAGMIIAVNGYLTYVFAAENLSGSPVSIAALCVGVLLYLAFVGYLVVGPERASVIRGQLSGRDQSGMVKASRTSGPGETDVEPLLESGLSTSSSVIGQAQA